MASSREVRRRIRSVANIGQITKAMELVAASRMRRAQETALAGRRYTFTMYAMLQNLLGHTDSEQHPLLRQYETEQPGKVLVVVFGPDKGLCGALVTNLMRELARFNQQHDQVDYVTMGKKARDAVRKLKGTIVADVPLHEKPRLTDVVPMTDIVLDDFMSGKYTHVFIATTHFVSVLRQHAEVRPLLPLSAEVIDRMTPVASAPEVLPAEDVEYVYEPGVNEVLNQLLPRFVEMTIFQSLLEALASEYAARMMAMKNAGDNAHELQQELVLTYNQLRQASITAELAEIASGAAA